MNAAKVTLTSTILAAALGLGLGLISTPGDSYACHKNANQHKPSNTDPCVDPEPAELVRTDVHWGGDIVEPETRLCFAQHVKPNGDNGEYACELQQPAMVNQVHYMLGEGVATARSVDPSLCFLFENIDLTPNRLYKYAWADNCGDDGFCSIQIFNWFQDNEVIVATEGDADFIRLVASVEADGMPLGLLNPFVFVDGLTLEVDEITVTFFANGSNKKLAVCQYESFLDVVTFQSDPHVPPE